MIFETQGKKFWLDEVMDALFSYLEKNGVSEDQTIICAAGMTPSCPIHFGIFREIFISYFVCEEIKKRGRNSHLIFYWDDYDHFIKIPYFTTKEKMTEHLGKPLTEVPDLDGKYPSYGEHYMRIFEENIKMFGIEPEYNYQTNEYASGKYAEYIRIAIRKRKEVYDIIHDVIKSKDNDDKINEFYPVVVYCENCGKDTTLVTQYDEENDSVSYKCKSCAFNGVYIIGKNFRGKLIWKVNWAMRWTMDNVLFESSGENHLTETGSYAVASKIASQIFGSGSAFSLLYRFIGMPGLAKVSRAQGEKTLSSRLAHLAEPAIVRWLFVKNSPDKHMTIDLEKGLKRLYSEWDVFIQNCIKGNACDIDKRIFSYATENIPYCDLAIPFTSVIAATGISCGDREKTASMLYKAWKTDIDYEQFKERLFPRFQCAWHAIYTYNMTDDVPILRTANNEIEKIENIEADPVVFDIVKSLTQKLDSVKTEIEIQELLFNLPKTALNIPPEEKQNPQVKSLQKQLYKTLYLLLLGKEEGPRLATILALMDKTQIKYLL